MSNPTFIQSIAALYGVVPSASFLPVLTSESTAVGGDDALLNHYYELVFQVNNGNTTAEVAARIAKNLGFSGNDATAQSEAIAARLDAVSINKRGALVKTIITELEGTASTNPVIAAFVEKKQVLTTALQDPSFVGISVAPPDGFAALSINQIRLSTLDPITTTALKAGAETVTGSAGIDIITGVVSSLSAERTLDSADSIDGGAGTKDRFEVSLKGSFAGFTKDTGGMKGVETLVLTNDSIISRSFNADNITGLKEVVLNARTGPISVTDLLEPGVTVRLNDQASGALALTFKSTAVTGTDDSVTLALSGVGSTTAVRLDVGSVENVTVQSLGSSNKFQLGSASSSIKSLTISGAANTVVTRETASSTTGARPELVDASGLSGTLNYTSTTADLDASNLTSFKGAAGANTISLTGAGAFKLGLLEGGAGADKFTVDAGIFGSAPTINGGGGSDELVFATGSSRTITPVMTGVEKITVNKTVTGALTIDAKDTSGLQTLEMGKVSAAFTLTNVKDSDLTVILNGALENVTETTEVKVDNIGATTVKVSSTAPAGSSNALKVTASKAGNLTLDVGEGATFLGTISAALATSVSLKSAAATTSKGTGIGSTTSASTIEAAKAEVVTIDSKGVLNVSVTAGVATSLNVTHADALATKSTATIALTTAKIEQLTMTTNAPTTLSGTVDSLALVNVTSSEGTLNLPALPKFTSGTLTGSGVTSGKESDLTLGSIGSSTNDAVNLTVVGFKNGSTNTPTITAKGSVSVDLSGVTAVTGKPLKLGAIQSTDGSVTVTANGSTSPFITIASVSAPKGVATVNLAKLGDNFGTSSGLIDVGGTTSTGVSYTGPSTKSSFVNITSNTVTVNGGNLADAFVVNGLAAGTAMTVSGNLGFAAGSGMDVLYITGGTALTSVNASGVSGGTNESFVVIGAARNTAGLDNFAASSTLPTTVVSITGSSTRDFIVAPGVSAGVTIAGGAGADIFSIPASGVSTASADVTTTASAKVTITNPVVITDFKNGTDMIAIQGLATASTLSANIVRGSYNATTREFTNSATPTGSSATGADALYYVNGGTDYAIVLQGFAASSSNVSDSGSATVPAVVLGSAPLAVTGLLGLA